MRKGFALLILCMASAFAALGQAQIERNFYGQLFGASTGFGFGFDSRFKAEGILGYSVGIGYTDISFDTYYGGDNSTDFKHLNVYSNGASIPLELNAIFGKRASKFELGVGATTYFISRKEVSTKYHLEYPDGSDFPELNWTGDSKKAFRTNIVGTLNVGYRLQRKSGFFLRAGVTLLLGDLRSSPIDGAVLLPNLCLGYTIQHF